MGSYGDSFDFIEHTRELSYLSWVPLDDLQKMCDELQKIEFSYQTQRTQGLKILGDISKVRSLFTKDKRFAGTGAYVCVEDKDWPKKFDQLQGALEYRPPDIAGTNKDLHDSSTSFRTNKGNNLNTSGKDKDKDGDNAEYAIQSKSERDRFDNAQKAFTSGISDMREQFGSSSYDQYKFEKEMRLTWKA